MKRKGERLLCGLLAAVLVLSAMSFHAKAAQTGWVTEGSTTYYYQPDGSKAVGWLVLDGKHYLFNSDGKMVTGWRNRGGGTYYFDPSTGVMKTGVTAIDGKLYYFESGGTWVKTSGWLKLGSTYYLINNDGTLQQGWRDRGGATYYFSPSNGAMQTGVVSIDSKLYYFESGGAWYKTPGWLKDGSNMYLVNKDGTLQQGWRERGGGKYYFYYSTGQMATGTVSLDGKLYFFSSGGVLQTSGGWVKDGGKVYLIDGKGDLVKGWRTRGGARYYFDPDTGEMQTGLLKIDGKYYYFTSGGPLYETPGFVKIGNATYLVSEDGSMAVGWQRWNGNDYYFAYGSAEMAKGSYQLGSKLYFFYDDGRSYTTPGWLKVNPEEIYLIGNNGGLVTGWKTRGGATYYFDEKTGQMAQGRKIVDGEVQYFSMGGELLDGDPMVKKAQGYYSPTNYLVLINCSEHRVEIFTGYKGHWTPYSTFPCGDGAAATPTPLGVYSVTCKTIYFDAGRARCWYASGFVGGEYLIHSILYYHESAPITVMDPTLGKAVSHGCVRVDTNIAKWIYEHVPVGSTVVTYK